MFNAVDREYRGAVWSSSIGTGPCDQMLKDTDVRPAQSALAAAETNGTSAFDASGDTAGLECKENLTGHWGAKPTPDDVGLDSMASLTSMTDIGGTTLSTDKNGVWLAEETWVDYAMQQGTGGGISAILARPDWQGFLSIQQDSGQKKHRLAPDVAAVADPETGMQVVLGQQWHTVGGTSLSAPLWAGFAALMNQYLLANGGQALGDLNPLLYRAAAPGAARPAFHDVTLGSNAVYSAGPGYDLVTGLGTPDVDNLVHDLLDIQKAGAHR
jgi:kumamolisin